MLASIASDLRFAVRSFFRRPAFTVLCVLIVAIGIGSLTTMYSLLHGVVLRPLPFEEPERLVWAWSTTETGRMNSVSAEDYFDYRERCDAFSSLAAHLVFKPSRVITGREEPERAATTTMSKNLFQTLGVEPLYGRSFVDEEEVLGGPAVVILSYAFWQRHFGGDPDSVIGRPMTIEGASFEVVGVMPRGFRYPEGIDLWFPMQRGGQAESGRGNNNFFVIGRLAEGVSIEAAQAQVDGVAARIAAAYPALKQGWGMRLVPLHERFFGDIRPVMLLLMGAIALVLLIVCANLSSLYLARMMSRRSELAVRISLGSSPWGVARQLLLESVGIAVLGAAAGIALAALGIETLRTLAADILPRIQGIGINGPVLLVTSGAVLATGLLFGVVPALHGSRVQLVAALKEGGPSSTEGARGLTMRGMLVVAQVALSLVLLIGSGLLIRSMLQLQQVDTGLEPHGLLTVDLQLPALQYDSEESRGLLIDDALGRLRAMPGVIGAAGADELPPSGGPYNYVHPAGRAPVTPSDANAATRRMVSDGFFETLRIPILAGRGFAPNDRLGAPLVTVVSRALAERLFPDGDALGSILVLPWGDGIQMEIVGIVGDVKDYGLDVDFRPVFYLPMRQYPGTSFRLVIRALGEPTGLVPGIRSILREVERDAPLFNIGTMEGWFSGSTAPQRLAAVLLATFAAIALLLAATGLYGMMAHLVAERTREIGIRMTLGAGRLQVMLRVLWRGAVLAGSGLAIGLLAAPALAQTLRGVLFATAPTDPLTYVGVSCILALVVLLASIVPARRAVRIDPTIALRHE